MNDSRQVSAVGQTTLLAASTLTVMAGATIAPSLPAMQAAFANVPDADFLVRLVLTLPALLIVICAPLAGIMIDRVGRKPLLLASTILYAVAGGSAFLLDSIWLILIGRALLGVAVAGIMTSVTTLIADYFAGEKRARLLGLQGSFMSLGGVFFLVFGGLLADVGWRFPFLIYLVSLVLLPFAWFFLFEPARVPQTTGKSDASLFGFIFADKNAILIFGAACFGMAVFYLIPLQIPFHLGELNRASGAQSGMAIACSNFFGALIALRYKQLQARFGFVKIYAAAFALIAAGFAVIGAANGFWIVLVGLAISGLGAGLLLPNASSWLTSIAPEQVRGRAVGALTMAFFFGQFISPFYSHPLVARFGVGKSFLMLSVVIAAAALFFTRLAVQQTKLAHEI